MPWISRKRFEAMADEIVDQQRLIRELDDALSTSKAYTVELERQLRLKVKRTRKQGGGAQQTTP